MSQVRYFGLTLLLCVAARATTPWQTMSLRTTTFDDEAFDYGLARTNKIHPAPYEAPTPIAVTGATTVATGVLREIMISAHPPLVIDVVNGNQTESLPTAVWLRGAGGGTDLRDEAQAKLVLNLNQLTAGDKARDIVFFCYSKTCWLSHNAVVRAVALGYRHVYWYRGGRRAWQAAGLPLTAIKYAQW
jgi:PQQ-dependent catabolism-associated CXXCW motif protein